MLRYAVLFGLFGLALATGLIIWSGYDQVLQALSVAGWGIVWTSSFHILSMMMSVAGWRALLSRNRPGFWSFLSVLWVRAAVNNLMPVARIGGEIVAVRMLLQKGVRKGQAIASTIVETTLSIMAVFLMTIIGVTLFSLRVTDEKIEGQLLTAILLSLPMILGLLAVQKIGVFHLMTKIFTLLFPDLWKSFSLSTSHLDRSIRTLYRYTNRIVICGFWQFVSWASGGIEIWLALYFLGHPLTLTESFMIEALIQATSSAAFIVPGALGVQEAGFLLFGHWLGLTPDVSAALAVMRRCRDLLLYAPGLVYWQFQEGKLWLRKPRQAA